MGTHTPGLVFCQLWPSMWQVCNVLMPCWAGGEMGSFPLEIVLVQGSELAGRPAAADCLYMTRFWINVSLHSCLCPRLCCGSADSSVCPSPSTEVMGCNYVISQERKEKTSCLVIVKIVIGFPFPLPLMLLLDLFYILKIDLW